MNAELASIKANTAFRWPKGLCLRARERIQILLPYAVLKDGTPIGEIIELSNDEARLAFCAPPTPRSIPNVILVELGAGETIRVNQATEAIVQGENGKVSSLISVLSRETKSVSEENELKRRR